MRMTARTRRTSNGSRPPRAHDGQGDRRVDLAAHLVDRLVQREAEHLLAVDMGDQVVAQDAGALGRRVVDRRHHLDEAVFHGDLDAEAAELAAGLDLHVLEALLVHVARMRIERRQHAVDRGFDQLGFLGALDIVGAHFFEDVPEQVELPVVLDSKCVCDTSVAALAPTSTPIIIRGSLRIIREPFRLAFPATRATDRSIRHPFEIRHTAPDHRTRRAPQPATRSKTLPLSRPALRRERTDPRRRLYYPSQPEEHSTRLRH
jgi:hypothetical protein